MTQEIYSNDATKTRCTDLRTIAKQTGDIDRRTAKRLAMETGSLLKIGNGKKGRYLVLTDVYWNGLIERYKVSGTD